MNSQEFNDQRIEKIINDHNTLVDRAHEEKKVASSRFKSSADRITTELISKVNDSVKEQTFSEIKDLIVYLTDELDKADNLEKITELRKKLNYYISIIKKELTKTEIDAVTIEDFSISINDYRKSISKTIRYANRNKNIDEMVELNSDFYELSDREFLNLRKLIKREQDYNRKNLNPKEKEEKKGAVTNLKVTMKNFETINQDYVNRRLYDIKRFYKMEELPSYDKKTGSNILSLVKNIPSYLKNKKIISAINTENEFFDKEVLNGFIDYNTKRNSIRLTLRGILDPKYRKTIDSMYLKNDAYCYYWIKNCYNESKILTR